MKFFMLTLLLFVPGLASSTEQFTISGAGTSSCGEFLEHQNDPTMKDVHITWAQGFLSGFNIAEARAGKELVGLPDAATISLYIVNYCTKNPLERPMGGAMSLYRELRARQSEPSRP